MVDRKWIRRGEHLVYITAKSCKGHRGDLGSTGHSAELGGHMSILGVSQTLTAVALSPETFKSLSRVARN